MKRKKERTLSKAMIGLLTGVGLLGVLVFFRELPALRRYVRISRM